MTALIFTVFDLEVGGGGFLNLFDFTFSAVKYKHITEGPGEE